MQRQLQKWPITTEAREAWMDREDRFTATFSAEIPKPQVWQQ